MLKIEFRDLEANEKFLQENDLNLQKQQTSLNNLSYAVNKSI